MTAVLPIPHHGSHDALSHHSRRVSSQPSLFFQAPQHYPRSNPYYPSQSPHLSHENQLHFPGSHSAPSSAPSSPPYNTAFSQQPSYISTPSTSLSSQTFTCEDDDDNYFPSYDSYTQAQISAEAEGPEPLPSPTSTGEAIPSTPSPPLSSALSRSNLYDPALVIGDDMAMRIEPTRHVDYLSHAWKEEDIWASWRHIVSWKKLYGDGVRLENASWRTWAKSKYKLKSMSPEALNWMKDSDVTWLYGPLQVGKCLQPQASSLPASQISRSNSFGVKKTILKKRSVSEVMLQRSLSSSTLMKQATDALRAQQIAKQNGGRSSFGNVGTAMKVSDFFSLSGDETPVTRTTTGLALSSDPSSSTSGVQTPSTGRRIRFDDKVEQCIAINHHGVDDGHCHVHSFADDSDSSDDELLMMAPFGRAAKSPRSGTPRASFGNDGKTIARLPATTLKNRGDTPEPGEETSDSSWSGPPGTPYLQSSMSEQTLRPTSRNSNFLLDDDDDADVGWQPSATRRGSIFPQGGYHINHDDDEEDSNDGYDPDYVSASYEDEDDDIARDGIFGKVVDTVNTAKDIAHVIWNVGWRGS